MIVAIFLSKGRVQVTTQADREEEEGQNQRMYRPAERFITRTSEAFGESQSFDTNTFNSPKLLLLARNVLTLVSCLPQTLGHLEKAVVLELTLKHLNALTAVTEQQHQKIIALQNGKVTQSQLGDMSTAACMTDSLKKKTNPLTDTEKKQK